MRLVTERRLMESSKMVLEDDDALVEVPRIPNLFWRDESVQTQTLSALNQMRKDKHFCDVILQVEKQDFHAHRAVLAATSPYLFELFTSKEDQPTQKETGLGILYELNGGFDKDALEKLIDYAYTGCLSVSGEKVNAVYAASIRLKMDKASEECARFLCLNLHLASCLDTRSLIGVITSKLSPDFVSKVDDFISDNLCNLKDSREFRVLPRICLEILHNSPEELESVLVPNICNLCLVWIHQIWDEDESLTMNDLTSKSYLLYIAQNNTLQDCEFIEENSRIHSERIQDYKKSNQSQPLKTKKLRRVYSVKPSKPRELLYSRHINQDEAKTEERMEDWKVIACMNLEDDKRVILSVVAVDGILCTLSVVQRVNTPTKSLSDQSTTTPVSRSPKISRPPSVEQEDFIHVGVMNEAKCAVGGECIDKKLIVCGGYDRGECLNSVELYDPHKNEWTSLEPMLTKRGRFDITASGGYIYAVGGSNGFSELDTVEKYDIQRRKWSYIASLPISISNNGACTLGDRIYCIGGLYGQAGTKACYVLSEDESSWKKISSLNVSRSQAGVCVFEGEIWVVGGCVSWNPLKNVEIYNPLSDVWRHGPPMTTPRRGCGLSVKSGKLYAIGGSDGTRSLCTTEIYDPLSGSWRAGPNMVNCRTNVSTVVVENRIWAIGGFSGKIFLNTAEYLESEEWTNYIIPKKPVTKDSDEEDSIEINSFNSKEENSLSPRNCLSN